MRPLRYVLAASEQTSFSAAADALGMKVSSVSRRVRNFEDAIGISLFERTPSGVRLTDGGRRFLDDIVPVLQMAEAILQRAGAAGRVEEGTVRVGIITTLAGGFLRELISSYRQRYPGVALVILDGGRRDQRWCRFLRQGHKVDRPMERTIQHEDTQTVYGRVQGQGCA